MGMFGKKGGNGGNSSGSSGSGKAKNVPIVGILLTALSALIIPLWILAFLGWCVQLGGLAAVQYNVGRKFVQVRRRVFAALSIHLSQVGSAEVVAMRLQFDWFVTALEFVTLFSIPFYLIIRRSTPGIVALKAVVTVLEILRTDGAKLTRQLVLPAPHKPALLSQQWCC